MLKLLQRKDIPFPYIILTIIVGSLNHFIYEWSGEHAFFALFCPINESVWEHLKLLFFPFLFFTVWYYYFHGKPFVSRYFCSRLLAVLSGMLFIVVFFYTYTGIIGRNFLVMDILSFIAGVVISYMLSAPFYNLAYCKNATVLVFAGWAFLILCFFLFTCHPPDLALFYSQA